MATTEEVHNGTAILHDLRFLCKFKKLKSGEQLTVSGIEDIQKQAAGCIRSLSEQWKSLRAITPRAAQT